MTMIEPWPRVTDRVSGDQQDCVDSAGQLGPAACNWMYSFAGMDLQLFSLNF
jgi:hypothetical protein